MKPFVYIICAVLCLTLVARTHAQEIWGLSTLSFVSVNPEQPLVSNGIICPPTRCSIHYIRGTEAYSDTQEDYVASLYYDVTSSSAIISGGNSYPDGEKTFTGNPTAAGSFTSENESNGSSRLKSEVTGHIVDFFYYASLGYYDPYGFSIVNNNPDGDYNYGYWFSVDVYAYYIAEASVLVGEDWSAGEDTYGKNFQGPNVMNVMYQAFIPPDYVYGPPASCFPNVYAGDNRISSNGSPIFMPDLGSFRAMQAISVGVGSYTGISPANAPPVQATGWSYEFSSSVLQNNMIPPSAYNYNALGACSKTGIDDYGKANTNSFDEPGVIYNGSNDTQTTLSGSASNPVPLFSFPIDWDVPLDLTEPNVADLHISGTLNSTCYPAHEVSVSGVDVGTWSPSSNNTVYITGCLAAPMTVHQPISADIPLVPYTPPPPPL